MLKREQSRAARGLLDWSQADLAEAAGLGHTTVRHFEADNQKLSDDAVGKIKGALESAGIQFIGDGETSGAGGVGVRLGKKGKGRSK